MGCDRLKVVKLFLIKERKERIMAKTIATVLGVAFILVGIIGFISPGFLGTHLSLTHNLVHIISGAVALYFGLAGSLSGARLFCLVFGAVYLLLGVVGFLLGGDQQHTIAGITHGPDSRLLQVIPGQLELATMDHTVHILLGIVFLIGGLLTKADVRAATD
jgi:hypothetical protein